MARGGGGVGVIGVVTIVVAVMLLMDYLKQQNISIPGIQLP
ncbi:MAG TPA: hypothetical protein VF444_13100 [Pseudonocardiaceae bacterium]